MSKDVNKVILIGRLGQDIDLRYTGNGKAVVNCTLATSSGKQGNEKTEWHRLVVWEKAAEIMAQYCKKGSKLYVEGRLETRKWQHSDGSDRYSTEIIVWEFIMLDSKGDAPSKPPEKPMRDDDGPSAPSPSAYDELPF